MVIQNKTETENEAAPSHLKVSRRVHPEDLNLGDDVAVLDTVHYLATCFWNGLDAYQHPPDQPIRLRMPDCESALPQKVQSICLPYVLCKLPNGKHWVHDLRRTQLTRLDADFARSVRKAWKGDIEINEGKKKKKKKGKGKKKKKRKSAK